MAFQDFADLMGRSGWGRPISKEQALEIASKNEEEGLVLQPANEQETQFICSCCGDWLRNSEDDQGHASAG